MNIHVTGATGMVDLALFVYLLKFKMNNHNHPINSAKGDETWYNKCKEKSGKTAKSLH